MTRAKSLIVETIMNSFDVRTLDDDFVTQIAVPTKSGPYLFTVEDDSVTVTNEENNINKTKPFTSFIQYLKGFTEHFEYKARRLTPTRGLDMTTIELKLTRNEELFLSELAPVALKAKTDVVNADNAISFDDCQARALLTTLTSKGVFLKTPSDEGMQYSITNTGYKALGYESPVPKEKRISKRPVDGKPIRTIADDIVGKKERRKPQETGRKNPRTEYPKGKPPKIEEYEEKIVDLKGVTSEWKKQPLCRELIMAGFDNAAVEKGIKELMDISFSSADINKQRRNLKRKNIYR